MQRHSFVFALILLIFALHMGSAAVLDDAVPANAASERENETLRRSTGEYLGQKWYIDEDHLMWWEGKPYLPYGGFGIRPGNEFGLNVYNLWIDFDSAISNPKYTREQHKRHIAARLKEIAESGGTCIVQFSMATPHIPDGPRAGMRWWKPQDGIDASRLTDPKVKQDIFNVWADYAPAVRYRCVRAVVLWNEINLWRWPDRISGDEYGKLLGEYVRQAKRLVGNLPICLKAAGTWNAEVVMAGATVADGLGFDVWFVHPQEKRARREIERALRMLESQQQKTSWFFIAEGGRAVAEDGMEGNEYWDNWPPFRSRKEAEGIMDAYARLGIKGFIYNGPNSDAQSKYYDSYKWLGELRPEICRLMVETKTPVRSDVRGGRVESSPARVIAAACRDPRVEKLLDDVRALRVIVKFSDRLSVWLIHFFSEDRRLGFASVSEDGKVLEVGLPESDERIRKEWPE